MRLILVLLIISSFCFGSTDRGQKTMYKFFKGNTTYIKNPFKLRDPFKKKISRERMKKAKQKSSFFTGVLDNEPTLDGVEIDRIRIVGVLLGKDRRALAKLATSEDSLGEQIYILREGMKLGTDEAEIKAILPGGVVLVEKIRNVYDQDEYLETIIPVAN